MMQAKDHVFKFYPDNSLYKIIIPAIVMFQAVRSIKGEESDAVAYVLLIGCLLYLFHRLYVLYRNEPFLVIDETGMTYKNKSISWAETRRVQWERRERGVLFLTIDLVMGNQVAIRMTELQADPSEVYGALKQVYPYIEPPLY